jgi:hypothetical protein
MLLYSYGCMFEKRSLTDINKARRILNLPPYVLTEEEQKNMTNDFLPFIKRKKPNDNDNEK